MDQASNNTPIVNRLVGRSRKYQKEPSTQRVVPKVERSVGPPRRQRNWSGHLNTSNTEPPEPEESAHARLRKIQFKLEQLKKENKKLKKRNEKLERKNNELNNVVEATNLQYFDLDERNNKLMKEPKTCSLQTLDMKPKDDELEKRTKNLRKDQPQLPSNSLSIQTLFTVTEPKVEIRGEEFTEVFTIGLVSKKDNSHFELTDSTGGNRISVWHPDAALVTVGDYFSVSGQLFIGSGSVVLLSTKTELSSVGQYELFEHQLRMAEFQR